MTFKPLSHRRDNRVAEPETGDQRLPRCAARRQAKRPPGVEVTQLDVKIGLRQGAMSALWPFDDPDRGLGEQIAQPQILQLLGITETIEIEMMQTPGAKRVGLDQGIGGTAHRAPMAKGAQQTAREGGLASAKVAIEVEHQGLWQMRGDLRTQGKLGLFIGQDEAES